MRSSSLLEDSYYQPFAGIFDTHFLPNNHPSPEGRLQRLLAAIKSLRERKNTVVVVEHEESMLRAADHLIEIGPGAGGRHSICK